MEQYNGSCSGYTKQHIEIKWNSTMNHVLDIQNNTYRLDGTVQLHHNPDRKMCQSGRIAK